MPSEGGDAAWRGTIKNRGVEMEVIIRIKDCTE